MKSFRTIAIVVAAAIFAGGVYLYISSRVPFAERTPAVGMKSPKIDLADQTGRMVHLPDHRGNPVVLYFWANWCPPCKDHLAVLEEIYREYGHQGVGIVGIGLDDFPETVAVERQITFSLVRINDRVRAAYGDINDVPATYILDGDGFIVRKTTGYPSADFLRDVFLQLSPKASP